LIAADVEQLTIGPAGCFILELALVPDSQNDRAIAAPYSSPTIYDVAQRGAQVGAVKCSDIDRKALLARTPEEQTKGPV